MVKELPKEPEPEPESTQPAATQTRAVAAPARDRNAEEEEAALQSPLFPGGASSSARSATPASVSSTDETLAALDRLRGSLPTPQDLTPPGQGQPSAADQRDSFLNAQLDESIYLKNGGSVANFV